MSDKGYSTPKNNRHVNTPFKTPHPYRTPKSKTEDVEYYTPACNSGDSMSSSSSEEGRSGATAASRGKLSIVAEFDELMRYLRQERCNKVEDLFIDFTDQMREMCVQWLVAMKECQRLQLTLDKKTHECSDLENKLSIARKFLDQEKRYARKVEQERDNLELQIVKVKDLLLRDNRSHLADETREKLAFLNSLTNTVYEGQGVLGGPQLSAIQEVNTTGSLLSDLSYSKSEDDLDLSIFQRDKMWKKHRPSTEHTEPAAKKRRSSTSKAVEISATDTVRATTTLTVSKDGPIRATSVIESVPAEPSAPPKTPTKEVLIETTVPSAPPADAVYDAWHRKPSDNGRNMRQHTFENKGLLLPDICRLCDKRIHFGRTVAKCSVCGAVCHPECKKKLPVPCIPMVNTPTKRGVLGTIADFTPTTPPMVPAIIVHCVNEIELRGFSEIGLYRVPGSERDVKNLKEKFLKRKGAPCLNQVDVHVLCGAVKDFLRSLREPLVTRRLWNDFVNAVEAQDVQDVAPALYQIISELPQPNRDTLAYMIVHLQKVASAKECKMPIENLAKVFGPTIVGYSSEDIDKQTIFNETASQARVMEFLLKLPSDYWASFVNVCPPSPAPLGKLQQTPSTDSLLRQTASRGFFTPSSRRMGKAKQKFFPTPPSGRY